ncbi:hypothetical protein A4H97_17615 [Niastella yeongjuensis]|uniref:Uncharacterized protein n=1 Tax=Niastella yeongjuensis TaxID=354355 RepID=A0A1V9E285_9BACT|nr:BACON domain-containing protein [Niastella yeongjuensis]OQP40035.1 hypothetical protein A4H97_17615 [Niastella yeongjuensis]
MKQISFVLVLCVAILSCHKKVDNPAPILDFNQTTLSLPATPGASADLIVESNIDWQVSLSSGADWLQLNKTSGHANDTIHITVIKESDGAQSRTASITAVPANTSISLQAQATIEQKPYNAQLLSQKTLGGNGTDNIDQAVHTSDGGLLLVGKTQSNKTGDVGTNHGSTDAWIIRLNSNLDTVWTRVMGGTGYDEAHKAIATTDGGFIVAGTTESNNSGDVGANHGASDWWIIKLKSNGDTAWTSVFGRAYDDALRGMAATADGGFVVAGYTVNKPSSSDVDVMVAKFNSSGNVVWQKIVGGTVEDFGRDVSVASDGSIYVVASTSNNNTRDVGASHGREDYWVIKLKDNGDPVWMKLFGGDQSDSPYAIASTTDGGAIITGSSTSNQSGDVGVNHGGQDLWVVKVNANGDMGWNKLLGGSGYEASHAVNATPDGGYLIAGSSNSTDGDVGPTQGADDLWVLKLNGAGQILWSKTFGSSGYDDESSLLLNSDGSFYVTGYTDNNPHGNGDGWLLKLKDQ